MVKPSLSRRYGCPACPKRFATQELLKTHIRYHIEEEPCWCDIEHKYCNISSDKESVNNGSCYNCFCHKLNYFNQKPVKSDSVRNLSPSSDALYNQKESSKHSASLSIKKCNICSKTFWNDSYFKKHKLLHSRAKFPSANVTESYCILCKKNFSQRCNYLRHMRIIHKITPEKIPAEHLYKCSICDKNFSNKGNLNKHRLTHTKNKVGDEESSKNKLTCFDQKPALSDSVKKSSSNVPSAQKNFKLSSLVSVKKCNICFKTFCNSNYLKKHQLLHLRVKFPSMFPPEACMFCHKSFSTKCNLQRHIREVHKTISGRNKDELWKCNICDKSLSTKQSLIRHNLTHTKDQQSKEKTSQKNNFEDRLINEKHILRNICGICQKSFTTSGSLKRHEMLHSGKKPFSCDFCSKRFYRSDHLKDHEFKC